ncbi:MAG: hypothetical protein IPH35_26380 [Rhodoferax sp.]|nr:hypothetical protein [Rhodoferax sp.]
MTSLSQSQKSFGLFDNVPADYLQFGRGDAFNARKVPELLSLKKEDISRITSVAQSSIRYDERIPLKVRERMEEIANTINMVASFFDGDVQRTVTWFKASNPLLGDVSPRDMIRLGRYDRLRKFIVNAAIARRDQPHASQTVAA